jgi:hypothetical protein
MSRSGARKSGPFAPTGSLFSLRRRETRFSGAETKAPKPSDRSAAAGVVLVGERTRSRVAKELEAQAATVHSPIG